MASSSLATAPINMRIDFAVGDKSNTYTVLSDDSPWCVASNDEDGLKLMIALEILRQRRTNETIDLDARKTVRR